MAIIELGTIPMGHLSPGESVDLIQLISGVNRQLEQAVEARLKPSGVPIEQYRVLRALDQRDGQPMGELASQVFVDSPTLTKIIDRMITHADVFRAPDPYDRRRVLIFRSEKGVASFRELDALVQGSEQGFAGRLDKTGAEQLRSLLAHLLK